MAAIRLLVRPSCRKKIRCPTPQRRATELPAARVALADAVAERAHGMQREIAERLEGDFALAGEARFRGGLIDDVTGLAADVLETLKPFVVEAVGGAGVGASDRRMNAAKFTTSEEQAAAGLLPVAARVRVLPSSGEPLN